MILPTGWLCAGSSRRVASRLTVENAGYYRFRVGDTRRPSSDGLIGGPASTPAMPRSRAEDVRGALPADRPLTLNLNTLLLETNGKRILSKPERANHGPQGGRIFENLPPLFTARDIDVVVVSHTHPDHVGNLGTAEGGKAFPRRRLCASCRLGLLRPNVRIFPTCRARRLSPQLRRGYQAER